MMKRKNNIGQNTLEYAVLVTVVVSALIAMSVYMRRAVNANLKVIEQTIEEEPQ